MNIQEIFDKLPKRYWSSYTHRCIEIPAFYREAVAIQMKMSYDRIEEVMETINAK